MTILSPCILPILPVILSSSVDPSGKKRPLGVVTGFVASFTFFTLFLSSIVSFTGISASSLRNFSIFVLISFGFSLLIPRFSVWMEILFSKMSNRLPKNQNKTGFWGGVLVGISLGLLWTPCVGPILASVISLAITGSVDLQSVFITLAYSLGTAIPMFLIIITGQNALRRIPWLLTNLNNIQKVFGVVMILTAIGIFFDVDRKFQTMILNTFPQYGTNITKFEDNEYIRSQLEKNNAINDADNTPLPKLAIGRPINEVSYPKGPPAPELIGGGKWFNSPPLEMSKLRGKVVLIDFWTYTCINCQRTLPYLRDWYEKYESKGLVIIGVHAPEFEFEKNPKNVEKAIKDFGLKYPVVQDNAFATWKAYRNQYWPAKYLIDSEGNIRYTHFGEGAYDETEKAIQELLKEMGESDQLPQVSNPSYENFANTPETYLGYWRIANFASSEKIKRDLLQQYTLSNKLKYDNFAFLGDWTVMEKYALPEKGAKLSLDFESKEVFLVMRPKNGKSGQVKILIDGKSEHLGEDVKDGIVIVDSDRLYKLIDLKKPGRHILDLEFIDNNLELFAFTFG